MTSPESSSKNTVADHDLIHLQAEVCRLNKVIEALIERAEKPLQDRSSAFGLFQSTVILEEQIRARTAELEATLQKNEEIRRELRLAASVYQYSSEAMIVTDSENRIVAVNPAFTALTGYSLQDVLLKNPRMLSSGQHDASLYQAMWESLNTKRHWRGEVANRKKSGELYIEWLSIVAVYDDDDVLQNYVALLSDITEDKKTTADMISLANYDPLTKLPNRRLFADRLDQAIKAADRSGFSCALLFIDLDHFKEVNDTLGHLAGDVLLVQVAERMKAELRATDTVARIGGDEFTVILPDIQNESAVRQVSEQVLEVLAQPFYLADKTVRISASIGAAIYPQDDIAVAELIQHADRAMYCSKKNGRNQVTLHADIAP